MNMTFNGPEFFERLAKRPYYLGNLKTIHIVIHTIPTLMNRKENILLYIFSLLFLYIRNILKTYCHFYVCMCVCRSALYHLHI